MHLGHLLDERQADAETGLRAAHVAIELHEHAEHPFLIFRRNADAGVAHDERHALVLRLAMTDTRPPDGVNLAALVRRLSTICEMRVASASRSNGVAGISSVRLTPAAGQLRLRRFNGAFDDRAQVDAFLAQRQLAASDAADVHQVVDQPHQLQDLPLHHAGGVARRLGRALHAEDRGDVAQRRQRVTELVRQRREEFILQLRFVVQAMLAILYRGTRFFGLVGAAFGLFLRLAQLRLHFLSLGDVHQQPLALGGERRLLVLLQRDVAERAQDAGQSAVVVALRMCAVFDVNEVTVLGDHARFAAGLRRRRRRG